jgi:hypothetical protein
MLVEICETSDRDTNRLIAMNEAQGHKVFIQKIRNNKTGFTRECYCVEILNHGNGYHSSTQYTAIPSGTYELKTV